MVMRSSDLGLILGTAATLTWFPQSPLSTYDKMSVSSRSLASNEKAVQVETKLIYKRAGPGQARNISARRRLSRYPSVMCLYRSSP